MNSPARFRTGSAPLYMTPPSSPAIQREMQAGTLGMIVTPGQGNKIPDGAWWCADNGCFTECYPGDEEFLELLESLQPYAERCLFAVAPDVPGDHFATWERSRDMLRGSGNSDILRHS